MINKMFPCNICNDIFEQFVIDNNIKKNIVLRHLNDKYKINIDEYISNDVIIEKVNNIPCGHCYLILKSLSYNYYDNIEKLFMDISEKNNIDYFYIYKLFYGYDV
jgi:hypothetical protein